MKLKIKTEKKLLLLYVLKIKFCLYKILQHYIDHAYKPLSPHPCVSVCIKINFKKNWKQCIAKSIFYGLDVSDEGKNKKRTPETLNL